MTKILVGLGNPGQEYAKTRHNAGEFLLAKIARAWGAQDLKKDLKAADWSQTKVGQTKVIFIFPQELMNNSGQSLKKVLGALKLRVRPADLAVFHDDLDIELGRVKLSLAKSSAGHKGVESVIKALKTNKFWRLRIGIQPKRKPNHKKTVDFILGKFTAGEEKLLSKNLRRIKLGLAAWLENAGKGMSLINTNQ